MSLVRRWYRVATLGFVAAGVAGVIAVAATGASSAGSPPPEVAPQADTWPAHNYDLANSRATTHTDINATNVATLKRKWSFKIPGSGVFGNFATTPIVLNGVVYFQDLSSNVYAVDEQTGTLKWKHTFNSTSIGPNGVSYGYGRLYGATEKFAFALDPANGKVVWRHTLATSVKVGIDMAPQLYDNKVLISTVPGSGVKHFYEAGAVGIVYALDATTGKTLWSFDTYPPTKRGKISGGGLWYPPAVGADGNIYLGVANPGLWPNSKSNPNASQRPGPNLYTDSLVALDGATGKLKWYRQVISHDVRDYDLMIPPVLYTPTGGSEIAIGAGKMGKVYAWKAATGTAVWRASVGKHLNDTGLLPKKQVTICPGDFGGVETPMAQAGGTLFVPWLNMCAVGSATSESVPAANFGTATGGLTAFDAATGKVKWSKKLPHANFGAATVANDVVFTSDFTGKIYAYSTADGKLLWTAQAPAGINAFPAVTQKMLIVGAGTPGLGTIKKPLFSLVAYSLG
ncbi:MAG: PQQ-binding-like beta-propeller repeat protein [Gaiellaceae bacterium]